MKKSALIIALFTLVSSFSYAESMQSLNKEQVMQALSDKTITTVPLATLHGTLIPNTVSVY